MKIIFALLGSFIIAQTCSSSEIHIASHCDTSYKFSKTVPIFLSVPDKPSAIEESNFSVIRESLVKSGFTLVDSAAQAQRLLTYYIRVGQKTNRTTKIGRSIVEKRTDSGLTKVTLAIFDANSPKNKKQKLVWQALLAVPDKDYETAPVILLCKLLKFYGKNKIKHDNFKSPK